MRHLSSRVSFALVALLAAACAPSPTAVALSQVAPLPRPVLPSWIASISPAGSDVPSLAQIRIIFAKPVTRVEALSGAGPRELLAHVRILPELAGHFVVLTPRMIGFVADQALPRATRVRVTLAAGLRDLDGDALANDVAWTFESAPLLLRGLPQVSASPDATAPPPVGLRPTIGITSNTALDSASLAAHATLQGAGESVALAVRLETTPTPYPGSGAAQRFDPSYDDWNYDLVPVRALRAGTTYALEIAPGVAPAYGNVASERAFSGGVRTYGPLALVTQSPSGSGRFAAGDPALTFSNPLDPASVAGAVTLVPAPANVKSLASVSDEDPSTISIDPYALDPDTAYTVTVAASLKDAFGQSLGRPVTRRIRTGDFAPGAWAPTGTTTIPSGARVDVNFYATNLPGGSYRSAYAPVPAVALLTGTDPLALLPSLGQWSVQHLAGARRNVQSVVRIPLQQRLGGAFGALAYGFSTQLDDPKGTPSFTGIAQLTDLGVFAQYFPARAYVLVQHLSSGVPDPGVRLAFYRIVSGENSTTAQACASGVTGAGGAFVLSGAPLESCYAGSSANNAPSVGIVATQGRDLATLATQSYSGVYAYAVQGGWAGGAPLSRGALFTDRQMYQPGERGEITGVAYYASGGSIIADRDAVYRVALIDPNNASTPLGRVTSDAYGVFSLPVTFSKQQALGYYTLDAKGANGNEISGSLRVAEFKPPNFKLDVTLGAASAVAGGSVHASAVAAYLFGAPLQGGVAHAVVTRGTANVAPKGWDDFSFGPQWFYPEQAPSFDTDVLQQDYPLDAQGKTAFDVAVPRDLPFPMTYTVDVATTDVSNLSVADSGSFLALPSDAVIGLASDAVGTAGSAMPLRVIVTDANGKAIAGRAVHLDLQKMTYTSATQEVEGGEEAQQAVRYDSVAAADATSADAPVSVTLTPPDPGVYRVRANFGASRSAATATDIQVFAFGSVPADWGTNDPSQTPIQLDKKRYAIGDTATALIASPFAHADVYVAVVRNDVLYRTVVRGASGSARVTFKITPEMLPNAAVQAVVVRRGGSLAGVAPGSLSALSTIGMTPFDVSVADRYLVLGIAPQSATVAPGGAQRLTFTLATKSGVPARGEIVAMVVNDAILQLTEYRLPDLVQSVFADQPISTVFSDNREGIALSTQSPPMEKGFGYGGGFLGGAGSTRVRANFLALAYYGKLTTDASGRAGAAFTMPDDLTTWRVMAVAVGSDLAHFATSDTTFVSSLPLMANPLLPQFARPGDRVDAGISLSNQSGTAGPLELVLSLSGSLAFATGGQAQTVHEPAATGMQAFRFPVSVGTPGPASFGAKATLGAQRDAFTVPFAVRDAASTDSVIESGATAKTASLPIALDRGGWLRITLANSIVPQFAVPADRVLDDDALPLADVAASRAIVASALVRLQAPYRLKLAFDPAAVRAASLQALLSYQRTDGGFAGYRGAAESDPFASAYAGSALLLARAQGASVPAAAIAAAKAFAAQTLANPGRFTWCAKAPLCEARMRFEMLDVLARAGDRRTDFLSDVVARSDGFDAATRIRLARYLLQTPGWRERGAKLADQLQQQLYVTGRYAAADVRSPWGWLGSTVQAQAQMLQLLLERHAPAEQLDGAVRALVAQACACGWPSADDTASALSALAAYAAAERLVPGYARVSIGGRVVATAHFGATASSQSVTLPASALRGNAAIVTSSGGSVHYLLLYTYPVPNDAPGELSAFRVVRTVAVPASTASPLATMDLAPAAPVQLAAGKVFDVGVRVIVDHPVSRLVIEDPLPAGFEAVDTSFRTTTTAVTALADSWEIDSQEIFSDKVVAYAQQLGPGVYEIHYLARSVTPGRFAWPGARAYLQDAPEQFGRSAATTLTVTP